jgi:gamma-glutamyl hydrolase
MSRHFLPFFGVFFAASLITAAFLPTQALPATSSPVIGILSQPYKSSTGDDDKYIIAASYAKWLESAGARTIPIPYDADDDMVDDIFSQINGVLLTGGSSDIPSAFKRLWFLVKEANLKNKEFFPVWGTCLG